ncbi:MAG: hypothetical protein R3F48_00815 [Candidatus Zixiibacteriota bacterium]
MKTTAMLLVLLLVCAAAVSAKGPRVVTYQGRLTDASGAPVPDGTYNITFSIYKTPTGTDSLWTSDAQSVTITGGLFSYDLGSNVPLPTRVFDNNVRYLGIKVGSDAELTPRIQLMSVPYAVESLYSDSADYLGDLGPDDIVHVVGDTMSGPLVFEGDGGTTNARIHSENEYANLFLRDNDDNKVALYGQLYGTLFLRDTDGDITAILNSTDESGGELTLRTETGGTAISLDGGATGNNSVELPDGAIDSDEILNEVGLARSISSTNVIIYGSRTLVDSVTITIPDAGYVYLQAYFKLLSENCENDCTCQFMLYKGEEMIDITSEWVDTLFNEYNFEVNGSVRGVVYESTAGTYTYTFQAIKTMHSSFDALVNHREVIGIYIPSSYGPVEGLYSKSAGFDNAESVEITTADGNTQTAYKVDLRELELKAKQAKIEAQEAYIKQLELERQLEDAKRGNN